MKLSIPLLLSLALHALLISGWQLDALRTQQKPEPIGIWIKSQAQEVSRELP